MILQLAGIAGDDAQRARQNIDQFAARGYHTLGVTRSDASGAWTFLGILPLFDPPREDSKDTIAKAEAHGIDVKMMTGDNVAIAREIAGQIGPGRNIEPATELFVGDERQEHLSNAAMEKIACADGLAEVFPEHKYGIVRALQEHGHLVAMTGDGVNDAPALTLKQADVGIVVSGATDAARGAADLVPRRCAHLGLLDCVVVRDGLGQDRHVRAHGHANAAASPLPAYAASAAASAWAA